MAQLRSALEDAGFEDVATYVQSGNVVLTSRDSAAQVAGVVERVIEKEFGLKIPVVVRTGAELAKVVERNPLAQVAKNPKRYQVSFLEKKPSAALMRKLEEVAARALRPADRLAEPQRPLRSQARVLALRLHFRAGLANDRERRGPGQQHDRLLVRAHPAGARSANFA